MIILLTVLLSIFGAGQNKIGATEASWTAEAHATGFLQAGAVPPAELAVEACDYIPGLLGARVEVYWSAPDGYELANANILADSSGLGAILAPLTGFNLQENTVENSGNDHDYTTTFRMNLLGSLLPLGDSLRIAIQMEHPQASTWTSDPVSVDVRTGLLISGSCSRPG
ncbi:hypothetical protein GCM10009720_04980 [Yaniella flava]|uniref:Uncharacterized protein n=2 Tax=Yaniella flava TaxID=287930 RepID=A0ABN2U3U3_9MICC